MQETVISEKVKAVHFDNSDLYYDLFRAASVPIKLKLLLLGNHYL